MGMSQNSGGPKCLIFWMKNKIWGPPIGWETQLWYPILNIIRAQNQTTGQPSCCCQDDLLPPHDWKHANLEPLRQFLKEQAEAGSWSPRFREGLWAQVDGAFAHEGMGYFSCHMLHKQRWLLFKFVETWGTAAVCFHMAHQKKWLCAHCDYTLQSEIKHTAKEFAQYGAKLHRKVKDDHNCDFILKLFAKIGLAVPGTIHPQRALIEIAKEQDLLGDTATTTDIEACGWIFCWVQKQPIHLLNLHVFINIGIPDVKRAWRHTWPWTSHSFPMRPSLSGMGIAGGWPAQGAAAVCHPPGWSESRVKEHLDRKMLGYLKTI